MMLMRHFIRDRGRLSMLVLLSLNLSVHWFFPSECRSESDYRLTRNLYVVFDASGSMFQRECAGGRLKIEVAKEALIAFLTRVPTETSLGLYVFDETGPHEAVALGDADRTRFVQTIKRIRAGGTTPLGTSIDAAREVLTRKREKQLGYGEYTMLIVTDGEADKPRSLPERVEQAADAGIVIQVIGFCLDGTHSLKTQVHKYREANSPEELSSALEAVLAEAEQYTDLTDFEAPAW